MVTIALREGEVYVTEKSSYRAGNKVLPVKRRLSGFERECLNIVALYFLIFFRKIYKIYLPYVIV